MMTISAQVENAARYLIRAEELRAIAAQTPECRRRDLLLNTADACEQMASWNSQAKNRSPRTVEPPLQ